MKYKKTLEAFAFMQFALCTYVAWVLVSCACVGVLEIAILHY